MKKAELLKLEGMTEEVADIIIGMSKTEMEGMIPKSRLDEVIAQRDNAKNEHNTVLEQLKALQKDAGDVDGMKKKIADLEASAVELQKKHESEIHKMKLDSAIDTALTDAKALNKRAVRSLLNDVDKFEFDDDGKVVGLDEQIEALKSADDSKFLFGSVAKLKGAVVGESGNEGGDKPVDVSKMSYTEFANYVETHPDAKF